MKRWATRERAERVETEPPPGKLKVQGADLARMGLPERPGIGWVDVDPTKDKFLSDRHITVAWGCDYTDVTPLKGVIYTDGGTDELKVEVESSPLTRSSWATHVDLGEARS